MTAETPTVHELVAALRRDLKAVGKDSESQYGAVRGIDDVFDGVGPVACTHGLVVRAEWQPPEVMGKQWLVIGSFWWQGPAGDEKQIADRVPAVMMNVAAAQSVSYRVALLQHLCIPIGSEEEAHHPPAPPDEKRRTQRTGGASAASSRGSSAEGPERSLPADNRERVRDALIAAAAGDTDAADAEWTRHGFNNPGRRNAGNVRYACELLSAAAKPAAEGEEPF